MWDPILGWVSETVSGGGLGGKNTYNTKLSNDVIITNVEIASSFAA